LIPYSSALAMLMSHTTIYQEIKKLDIKVYFTIVAEGRLSNG